MYYFVGSLFPNELNEQIYMESKGRIDNAANTFQWAFIDGFEKNGYPIKIITLPGVGTFPLHYKGLHIKQISFSHAELVRDISLSFCTLPIIGLISRYFSLKKQLNKELTKNDVIIVYSLKSAFLLACWKMKRLYPNLCVCVIVPDLPNFMSESKNPIYRFLKKIDSYIINETLKIVNSFVVLSDAMVEVLNVGSRQWVRIEGIYSEQENISVEKQSNFVFAYTGTLDVRYGILNLIKSFMKLKGENFRLWICGKGNAEKYLKQCCGEDDRIRYWGQLKRSDVIRMQREVTVLVNPRTAESEYTKYSFPSKTMEYMGSGTPCIMYDLPSLPREYKKYLFLVDSDGDDALLEKMLEVSHISRSELNLKGESARYFVQKYKSAQAQVSKVIAMLTNK